MGTSNSNKPTEADPEALVNEVSALVAKILVGPYSTEEKKGKIEKLLAMLDDSDQGEAAESIRRRCRRKGLHLIEGRLSPTPKTAGAQARRLLS